MAFLDWMKNRGKQQAVAPKPQTQENAKQWYLRQDAEVRATQPKLEQISETAKGRTREARAVLENYGNKVLENNPGFQTKDVEGSASPQPMRQNMVRQHIHPPALSPTSGQSGLEHQHTGAPASETPRPETPKPEAPKPPQPTIPRRQPSWER
ncbi:MAG: hypothetical protein WBY44_03130 [Bryobacteraceae bacterium]